MMSVTSVRVRNLRSLQDSGEIERKPITVLVGHNSSGKSSFARVFPLLRQSTEATKRGPVLWWGRLVDLGSFSEAVNRHAEKQEIGLDFRVSFDARDLSAVNTRTRGGPSIFEVLEPGVMDISVRIRNGEDGSYTSGLSLSIFDFHANVSLDEQGLVTEISSGASSWKPSAQVVCYGRQDSLMPNPPVGHFKLPHLWPPKLPQAGSWKL